MEYTIKNKERISDNVLEEFFINRGFNKEDIFHYLNTTDEDILSPMLLDNMAEGAKMLLDCINNNEKIFSCSTPISQIIPGGKAKMCSISYTSQHWIS